MPEGCADTLIFLKVCCAARTLMASSIDLAAMGRGPKTPGHPMAAFAGEFLERHGCHRMPYATETNRIVRKNTLPAFGHVTVDAMPILSVLMHVAGLWGYRAHHTNPSNRTRHYKAKPKACFLAAGETPPSNAVLTRNEFWCRYIVDYRSPADSGRVPLRRDGPAQMGVTQGYAHPSSDICLGSGDTHSAKSKQHRSPQSAGRESGCKRKT